jgi:transcriptional regulator with XRE-family HTH domain
MDVENRIGEFLRARREQARPEDVGLPHLGRRQVPGLRREELAMLAGVSSDYYVGLEQGRERHPSEPVLEALARALILDDPDLIELVGELSVKRELFRRLWTRHDVREKSEGYKRFTHPLVVPLELRYESFTVNGADGQLLIVYHAEPGSTTEQSLALLSSLIAEERADPRRNSQRT